MREKGKPPQKHPSRTRFPSRVCPDIRAHFNHLLTEREIDMDSVIILKNVRLSFPQLWVAKPFNPGDAPAYKATGLIVKGSDNDKLVRETIRELAKEKWSKGFEQKLKAIETNPNKFCYQDGDNKKWDGYEGCMVLSAKAKESKPPIILDRDKTQLREKDGRPYAGCYVNMSVEFFTYNNSGDGISSSLRWVQFFKDGDAFAGGTAVDVDEEIEDLSDGSDAEELA